MYRPFPTLELDSYIVSVQIITGVMQEFCLTPVELYQAMSGLRTLPRALAYCTFLLPYYSFMFITLLIVIAVNVVMAILSLIVSIGEYAIDILAYFVVNRRAIFGDKTVDSLKRIAYRFLLKE